MEFIGGTEGMQGMDRRGVCTAAQLLPPLHLCCFLLHALLLLLSRDIPDGSRCGETAFWGAHQEQVAYVVTLGAF